MGTRFTRLYKLDWLFTEIKTAADLGKIVNEEELLAKYITFFGSTRKTGLELLRTLELTYKIVREFKEIWLKEKYDEQKALEKSDDIKNNLEGKPENAE